LNVQHQAIKYLQGNKNYLAPIDSVLKAEEGVEKRVLDIGCGKYCLSKVRRNPLTDLQVLEFGELNFLISVSL
jgi:hypothetical protein